MLTHDGVLFADAADEARRHLTLRLRRKRGNRKLVCSGCGKRVHEIVETYERKVRDLPWSQYRATVVIELHRVRCPDCGIFCRRVGPGGPCPHCDEPVALTDLVSKIEAILAAHPFDMAGWGKVDEVPFDFERRRLTVAVACGDTRLIVTKGAPEAVLAAAGIKCLGGDMQCKMWPRDEKERKKLVEEGYEKELDRIYSADDLANGKNIVFCATGISDSALLRGVRSQGATAITHSILMRAKSRTVRFIRASHDLSQKTIRLRTTNREARI